LESADHARAGAGSGMNARRGRSSSEKRAEEEARFGFHEVIGIRLTTCSEIDIVSSFLTCTQFRIRIEIAEEIFIGSHNLASFSDMAYMLQPRRRPYFTSTPRPHVISHPHPPMLGRSSSHRFRCRFHIYERPLAVDHVQTTQSISPYCIRNFISCSAISFFANWQMTNDEHVQIGANWLIRRGTHFAQVHWLNNRHSLH
jgi:hypothetical protein